MNCLVLRPIGSVHSRQQRQPAVRRCMDGIIHEALARCMLVVLLDEVPIHQPVEARVDVVRPPSLVVKVVRTFPHIDSQQWYDFIRQRVPPARGFHDLHAFLLSIVSQPKPTRAECSLRRRYHFFSKRLVRTEITYNRLGHEATWLPAPAFALHAFEEKAEIVALACVVVQFRIRLPYFRAAYYLLNAQFSVLRLACVEQLIDVAYASICARDKVENSRSSVTYDFQVNTYLA